LPELALDRSDAPPTRSLPMSAPYDLKDVYFDEIKDLRSANDQMRKVLKKITTEAYNPRLKEMLTTSRERITKHMGNCKEKCLGGRGGKVNGR
jgi:ferritin-like metal-binding protein YciE